MRKIEYPKSDSFNKYFMELADLAGVAIPFVFVSGDLYREEEINTNFEVVISALKEKLRNEKNQNL